jgi:hypothetical protein
MLPDNFRNFFKRLKEISLLLKKIGLEPIMMLKKYLRTFFEDARKKIGQ